MNRTYYADSTEAWVPLAGIAIITGMVWGSSVWQDFDVIFATQLAIGVAIVLGLALVTHGRLYWRRQVSRLSMVDGRLEARLARWLGPDKRVQFPSSSILDWRIVPKPAALSDSPKPPNLVFSVNGRDYDVSLHSPKLLDLAGLRDLSPAFFNALLSNYPQLLSVGVV